MIPWRGRMVTELMKQPQYHPLQVWEMALTLFAVNNGSFDDVEIKKALLMERALRDCNLSVRFLHTWLCPNSLNCVEFTIHPNAAHDRTASSLRPPLSRARNRSERPTMDKQLMEMVLPRLARRLHRQLRRFHSGELDHKQFSKKFESLLQNQYAWLSQQGVPEAEAMQCTLPGRAIVDLDRLERICHQSPIATSWSELLAIE